MSAAQATAVRPRREAVPSSVLGALILVLAEGMFFAGTMSAYTISRANAAMLWPPPGQPRLPAQESLFNTLVLGASALVLVAAHWLFVTRPALAKWPLAVAALLGAGFLGLQWHTWATLSAQGLTVSSSALGSFFVLIVGGHTLHTVAALGALGLAAVQAFRGRLTAAAFFGTQVFWYFGGALWVVVYLRLYY